VAGDLVARARQHTLLANSCQISFDGCCCGLGMTGSGGPLRKHQKALKQNRTALQYRSIVAQRIALLIAWQSESVSRQKPTGDFRPVSSATKMV